MDLPKPFWTMQCATACCNACRTLKPIASAEYPTPAARPKNSRLAGERLGKRFGVALPDWRQGLSACIEEMNAGK